MSIQVKKVLSISWPRYPPQSWGPGRGVYLGSGLVITAAHVVTPVARTKPNVRIADMDLPANAIKEGDFERVDLTLLSIDARKLPIYLQMRRMPLCENQPWPGEPVVVAVPEGTARSHVMLPALLPAKVQKRFSTAIKDVATTGNSGSGVFDAGQKCLLGIMSRKITVSPNSKALESEQKDIAKYFVPASTRIVRMSKAPERTVSCRQQRPPQWVSIRAGTSYARASDQALNAQSAARRGRCPARCGKPRFAAIHDAGHVDRTASLLL